MDANVEKQAPSFWEKLTPTPAQDLNARFLLALDRLAGQVYQGTVPAKVKAKRRAANRVARRSRRVNRLRAA